jgi:hypothetical protein
MLPSVGKADCSKIAYSSNGWCANSHEIRAEQLEDWALFEMLAAELWRLSPRTTQT